MENFIFLRRVSFTSSIKIACNVFIKLHIFFEKLFMIFKIEMTVNNVMISSVAITAAKKSMIVLYYGPEIKPELTSFPCLPVNWTKWPVMLNHFSKKAIISKCRRFWLCKLKVMTSAKRFLPIWFLWGHTTSLSDFMVITKVVQI